MKKRGFLLLLLFSNSVACAKPKDNLEAFYCARVAYFKITEFVYHEMTKRREAAERDFEPKLAKMKSYFASLDQEGQEKILKIQSQYQTADKGLFDAETELFHKVVRNDRIIGKFNYWRICPEVETVAKTVYQKYSKIILMDNVDFHLIRSNRQQFIETQRERLNKIEPKIREDLKSGLLEIWEE